MRIKEGQMLELKNGQTIGAEKEIERFATVLLSAGLRGYLLRPQYYEEHRALVETGGEDVIWQIAREMYDRAVKMDEMISEIFDRTALSEDEKETFLQGLKEAYAKKAKEGEHERA